MVVSGRIGINWHYADDWVALACGDCLEPLPKIGRVDHVITDPPYARDVYLRMGRQVSFQETGPAMRGSAPFIRRMAASEIGVIGEIRRDVSTEIARLASRWVLVFSDVESCHLWRADLEQMGMRYVRTGAWIKPDSMPQMSGDRPAVGFEPMTIMHAPGVKMRWNGGGGRAVWTHRTVKSRDRVNHPCPKPLSLICELINQFTDPGDLILDPFAGSGTTLLAAKQLGRRAIGFELKHEYCEIAVGRLRQECLPIERPAPMRQERLL